MEKTIYSDKEDFPRFEQIAEPIYALNLIVLIIAIIFCSFLFRMT